MPQPQPSPASSPAEVMADLPPDEWKKHRGHWIALSGDGSRIVASSATLTELDAKVRAVGQDPEEVLLERIPDGDSIGSGSELS